MKLIEVYSTHSGLKIDKPILVDEFYPLAEDNYITFHGGGGNGNFTSKIYDFWEYVIYLLKQNGLKEKIVQLGVQSEPLVAGVDIDLRGQKIRQSFYTQKNAKLHFGNDSFPVHVAGAYNVPVVCPYGPTTPTNHGPYWKNDKSILIESDRKGKKCSYSSHEYDKVINYIKPETIANAILQILGYPEIKTETVFLGKLANQVVIEYIPDFVLHPDPFKDILLTARLDYVFNQENLFNTMMHRKMNIVCKDELNLDYVKKFRPHIAMLNFEVQENISEEFLQNLKRTGVPLKFFSRLQGAELEKLRFKFFEIGNIDQINDNTVKMESGTTFKTNKILLSEGKFYNSYAHYLAKKSSEQPGMPAEVIDDQNFWKDLEFFWIYK